MSEDRSRPDAVIRAMTNDGAFRVIAAITTESTQEAISRQGAAGDAAVRLAELMTAAVLIRETTQPARRVQIMWRDRNDAALVADSLPDGKSRGMVNPGQPNAVVDSGEHTFQVNYTHRNGALHQSFIQVESGDSMSAAVMRYMQESEQTVSIAQICAISGGGVVRSVGGFLVQLLPEATTEVLSEMTDRLGNLPPLEQWLENTGNTTGIIATLLDGFEFTELAHSPLRFGCTCSEERFVLGILTLADEQIDEIASDETIEARCDACNEVYRFTAERLREVQAAQRGRFQA